MGNSASLRIIKEPQSRSYKQILEMCLKTFPTSNIDNVHLANLLFSRIPKPFAQRVFGIFPESIPFESVVALVYIFMVSPRHTRACFIADLYIGNKKELSRDQVYRFFYELTIETDSNIDLMLALDDFNSAVSLGGCSDAELIEYLSTYIKLDKYSNAPIFRWIANGGEMPEKGYPLIDPERTVGDLLLMWEISKSKVVTTKHTKTNSKIISSYITLEVLCSFKERSIKELRQIFYLLRPLQHSNKGISIDIVTAVFAPYVNNALLVPLANSIKDGRYDEFFIAMCFATKESKTEKLQFVKELLNPPKEGTVNTGFITPFVEAICMFSAVIHQSVGSGFEVQTKTNELVWGELQPLGNQFSYDDFEQTIISNANLDVMIDQLTQATLVLHGALPKKIETEAQVFNALINMYDVGKMKPGEVVILIPSSWFSKWAMMLNSNKREPIEKINFNSIADDKIPMALKPKIQEGDVLPVHREVFLAIDSWYKHEGNIIERKLYFDEKKKKVEIEFFPLKLYSFIHVKDVLEIPKSKSTNDVLVISRYSSLRDLHKSLCAKFKLPINKTRVLMFVDGIKPLIVPISDDVEIRKYFGESSWVCLQSIQLSSEIQTVYDELAVGIHGGEYGIFNEGNTCYINSVIQALSHTPLITNFFLSNAYKEDVADGPLKAIATSFSNLLYKLWKPSTKPITVSLDNFREILITATQMFNDEEQHDAWEYLSYLLDCLHESVNRNAGSGLPYADVRENDLDFVVKNAWKEFNTLNQSLVSDLMAVMIKSNYHCDYCHQTKYLIEPTFIVSVPLPSEKFKIIDFTVVPMDGQVPIKYSVKCGHDQLLGQCLAELSSMCGLSVNNMLCVNAPGSVIVDILRDSSPIKSLTGGVKVFEVDKMPTILSEKKCLNSVVTKTIKRPTTTNKMAKSSRQSMEVELRTSFRNTVTIPQTALTPLRIMSGLTSKKGVVVVNCLNRIVTENQIYFFNKHNISVVSLPFALTFSIEDLTVANIARGILRHVRVALRQVLQQEDKSFVDLPISFNIEYMLTKGLDQLPFDLRVTSYDGKNCFQCSWDKDCCGCALTDEILQHYNFNEFSFTISIDWKNDSSCRYDQSIMDLFIKDESVTRLRELQSKSIQLTECFKLLSLKEEVGIENGWICPQCKTIRSCRKSTSVYSLPLCLIIQLKRFTQVGDKWSKSNIEVNFPLEGLKGKDIVGDDIQTTEEDVYDLYAVINHTGTLNEGHYTTLCKVDLERWLKFDDKSVSQISQNAVISDAAYILFYQKRNSKLEELMNKYHFSDQKELLTQSCAIV